MDYKEKVIELLKSKELSKEEKEKLEDIFPELAESEDEKIRKQIKAFIKSRGSQITQSKTDAWLAWLEKQNSNADKVEPKFKVGDFIVNDYCMGRIVEITNDAYLLDTEQGIPFSCNSTRLWDITKDAKDGDVLYCKSDCGIEYIVMSKSVNNHNNIDSYFRYNSLDGFGVDIPSVLSIRHDDITPATKEQRNLLFQKMKEAGYEWDAEKKELKKIEQKPAWSEDDEARFESCIKVLQTSDGYDTINAKWLKSLKDRVQPKQEWSALDEINLQGVIDEIQANKNNAPDYDLETYDRLLNWLKSLSPQKQWKPSEEQMAALRHVVVNTNASVLNPKLLQTLVCLENDLKAL